ncbi:hypothetical protein [Pontibacillus yanchengensis]|nr:hypothetical protein [Pontibacillus yanchengensis]
MITGIMTLFILCGVEMAGMYAVLRNRNQPIHMEEFEQWFYD